MRLDAFFDGFFHFLNFQGTFVPNNGKLLLILLNLIFTSRERDTEGDSQHVSRNFWSLIMVSTKLMQYVAICHDILLEVNFYKKHQSLF